MLERISNELEEWMIMKGYDIVPDLGIGVIVVKDGYISTNDFIELEEHMEMHGFESKSIVSTSRNWNRDRVGIFFKPAGE